MMDFLNCHKKKIIVLLIILCVGMMVYSVYFRYRPPFMVNALAFVVTPLQSAMTSFGDFIGARVDFFVNMGNLDDENRRLKAENDILSIENRRLRLVEEDSIRISALLGLQELYPNHQMLGARVISRDPISFNSIFNIDKGSSHMVDVNMAVLSGSGLAGRVFEVGSNYAKVLSIIDDSSAVFAVNIRTGDLGTVVGHSEYMVRNKALMRMTDVNADIAVGDEIHTSRASSIFPPAILIGYVTDVFVDDGTMTKYAEIQPAADFDDLGLVLIIMKRFDIR
jgi:rod shape-determining protein MreC